MRGQWKKKLKKKDIKRDEQEIFWLKELGKTFGEHRDNAIVQPLQQQKETVR